MDVPLYAIALGVFGALYLVFGVFLVFALAFSLLAMYLFLTLRWGRLPDDYPYGAADTMTVAVFIGVTWGVFTLLGPKNPIPVVGSGLTYQALPFPIGGIVAISVIFLLAFVVVGAFVVPRLSERGRTGGPPQQGQQPVGS